ncbi:MAG: hypothetical protein JWP32_1529 [Schumannella sp.]|nr:hypothetical protein [Schumannella sp.]
MKRVSYAGGSFVSGDRIVEAVTRFATANANADRASEIQIPVLDIDGREQTIGMVVGPASQLFYEPVIAPEELIDEEFVARIDALTQHLIEASGVNATP